MSGLDIVEPAEEEASARMNESARLTHRAVKAGVWNGLLRTFVRGAGFLRNIIFARLLAPEDIGQFGIALVILSIVDRFSHTGLQAALIQKKESIDEYLDTGWTVQMLRSAGLAAVCFVAAPWVAAFFGDPMAGPLVRALAIYLFLRGLASPAIMVFRRQLEFRKQFAIRASATIANLVVSVAAAFVIKSAWALMIGLIAAAFATVVTSYIVHPYRPRIVVNWAQLRELSTFGRWVFLNSVLMFLVYRGDNLIVGKLLGAVGLGVYMLAYSISEVATVEISKMATEVAMPAYSRAQEKIERVRRGFTTALDLILSITLPIAVVLAALAVPITNLLLGERWMAVATVLPILALAGPIRCVTANTASVFLGMGRPDLSFQQNLISVVATYAVIVPLAMRYGLAGVGAAVLLGLCATAPFAFMHARRLLQLSRRDVLSVCLPSLGLGLTVLVALVLVRTILPGDSLLVTVVALITATLSYGGAALVMWSRWHRGPLRILELLKSRRSRRAVGNTDQAVLVPN